MFGSLQNFGKLGASGGTSNLIAQLFAGGTNGFAAGLSVTEAYQKGWLFQDAAGTTPAALEMPVGLALDASQGLVLGPELITNGDFSNGSTGWSAIGGPWSFAGSASVTSPAAGVTLSSSGTVQVGKWYVFEFDLTCTSGGFGQIYLGGIGTGFAASSGHYKRIIKAVATQQQAVFDSGGFSGSVDNVSVRELPGNHASQATTTKRLTLKDGGDTGYYLSGDYVDDVLPVSLPAFDGEAWINTAVGYYKGEVHQATTYNLPLCAPTAAIIRQGNLTGALKDRLAQQFDTAEQYLVWQTNTLTPYFSAQTGTSTLIFKGANGVEVAKVNPNGTLTLAADGLTAPVLVRMAANTALTVFYCYANQLTGSIPSLSSNTALTVFHCSSNQLTGFTGGVTQTLGYFDASTNALTLAAVDSILAAFVAANRTTGSRELYLQGGTNAAPSAAGLADKATLVSRGWTVLTN